MQINFYNWIDTKLQEYQFFLFPTVTLDISHSWDLSYYIIDLSMFFWTLEIVWVKKD